MKQQAGLGLPPCGQTNWRTCTVCAYYTDDEIASHALHAYHSLRVKTEVYFGLTAEGKEQFRLLTFVWNDPTNSVPYPAVSLKGTKITAGTSPEWDL